jgi:hypothetical protein
MSQKPSRLAWLISHAFQIAKDSGQAHTPNPLPSGLNWRVMVDPAGLRRMAVWRTKSTQPSGKEIEVMTRDAGFEKYGLSEHTSNQGITRTIIDECPSTLEIDPEDELDYLAGKLEAAIPTATTDDVAAMTLEPFQMPAAILERKKIATDKLMALTGHLNESARAMRLAYLGTLDVDELETEVKTYGPARVLAEVTERPAWDDLGAVRDEIKRAERVSQGTGSAPTYEEVVIDSGIEDKRVLVLEGEFAQVLNVLAREGNTLGVVMRNAWDGSNLSILTKASAAQATDPHVSILGHITAEELHAKLTSTDAHNGVGNKILWVYVRRSKCLPFTPRPDQDVLEQLAGELAQRITNAQTIGLVEWAEDAAQKWEKVYPSLTAGRAGLVGSLTARAAPQVIRMAMLYAAIDGINKINLEHLRAALALWQYCEASVNFIFKARSGDPVKAKVQQYLEAAGEAGMTRSGIGEALGNHVRSAELELVLTSLEQDQIISRVLVKPAKGSGGGRPREMFRAVKRAG